MEMLSQQYLRLYCTAPAQGMEWEDQEDTGLGWLGPENIDEAVQDAGWGSAKPLNKSQVAVACVTTDFAMQNVLIQMGLKVCLAVYGSCSPCDIGALCGWDGDPEGPDLHPQVRGLLQDYH